MDGKGGADMRITKAVMTIVVLVGFAAINADLAMSQDDQELEEMALNMGNVELVDLEKLSC